MGRILAIDFGLKRCGLAVTDVLQISVNPLRVISTDKLVDFIQNYCEAEPVEKIVFGESLHADGTPTYLQQEIESYAERLRNLTSIPIDYQDESYTSSEAREILLKTTGKKKRKQKELTDLVSAVLILQRYLNHI